MDKGIKIGLASFIATAAALLAVPQGADAHPRHGEAMTRAALETQVAERFAAMDADGDGTVTRAEAEAHREARRAERRARMFDRLDADGDGEVTAEERAAMRGRHHRRAGRPEMAENANMRARLTPEELAPLAEATDDEAIVARPDRAERRVRRAERRTAVWNAADADGNGSLSRAEFEAMAAMRHGRRAARRSDGPDRFARADADGDGSLTLAEVSTRALARFDAADANGDGTLTREERRAAHRARRAERWGPTE